MEMALLIRSLLLAATFLFVLALLCATFWLLWHILRQQGRLLLGIETTEARLAEVALAPLEEQVESSVTGLGGGTQERGFRQPGHDGTFGSPLVRSGETTQRLVEAEPMRSSVLRAAAASYTNGSGTTGVPGSPAGPGIGDVAPDFSLPDLKGSLVHLSDFQGGPTLVLFWSPSCSFCRDMLPHLLVWEAHPPEGVPRLLVVSTDSVADNQALGLRSPIVLEPSDRSIGSRFGATGTPMAVLVDAESRIASELVVGAPAILALASTQPREAERRIELTIGMATYNDFDGAYFTLQALRLYQDLSGTELLVIDNYGCQHTQKLVEGWLGARYIRATDVVGTAAPRDLVFGEARGNAVLCCDSHVLFAPGVIALLKQYYCEHPESQDLLQGPLLADNGKLMGTHFDPVWRGQMWGTWGTDPRGLDEGGEPFEIPMQGLGVFSCRRSAWLGFHPKFRGFGGEEGYIHEKFRQAGHRTLCLPWLRWMHRFGRPSGIKYPLFVEDKLRNYVLGHAELGLDLAPVLRHFAEHLPEERVIALAEQALGGRWTGSGSQMKADPVHRERKRPGNPRETETITASDEMNRGVMPHLEPVQPSLSSLVRPAWKGGRPARAKTGMKISCICATYNRPPKYQWLLEEAIESFLRQDYAEKELLVLNDCPGQELICDAPGVLVINFPRRFSSWGEKLNAGIGLSQGSLIAPWDDDDIMLPWRLSKSLERLADADYYNPHAYWFLSAQGLQTDRATGVGQNGSLFTHSAFDVVNGYPHVSGGGDLLLDQLLLRHPKVKQATPSVLALHEWFYIYRWGVSPLHLSANNMPHTERYKQIGQVPVIQGRYVLRPQWREEYVQTTRYALGMSPYEVKR